LRLNSSECKIVSPSTSCKAIGSVASQCRFGLQCPGKHAKRHSGGGSSALIYSKQRRSCEGLTLRAAHPASSCTPPHSSGRREVAWKRICVGHAAGPWHKLAIHKKKARGEEKSGAGHSRTRERSRSDPRTPLSLSFRHWSPPPFVACLFLRGVCDAKQRA
jgi:hypothetical protein